MIVSVHFRLYLFGLHESQLTERVDGEATRPHAKRISVVIETNTPVCMERWHTQIFGTYRKFIHTIYDITEIMWSINKSMWHTYTHMKWNGVVQCWIVHASVVRMGFDIYECDSNITSSAHSLFLTFCRFLWTSGPKCWDFRSLILLSLSFFPSFFDFVINKSIRMYTRSYRYTPCSTLDMRHIFVLLLLLLWHKHMAAAIVAHP